jgi:DNA polymerase-3 subunit delta
MHPLQILAAMTNQIRKLLMAKDFVESPHGSQWQTGARYDFFKSRISPAIQNYDRTLLEHLEGWEGLLAVASDDMTERAKKKSSKIRTDLMILKNPQNPYPVYQLLLKSDRFAKSELLSAVEHLHQADLKLKRSGQRPQLILEEFILKLCGSGQKTEAAAS